MKEKSVNENQNKSSIFKLIGKIAIAGVLAILFLSLFVWAFSNSGVHSVNPTRATDYTWEPHQWKSNISEGFSWIELDEDGFNNAGIPEQTDVLLMGSSHMEAVQVAQGENTGYLLGELLPDKSVYNIGISGHTIYTCVQNMRDAASYYNPSEYIILETSTVELDIDSMKQVIEEDYPEIPSYDSGVLYAIQKKLPVVKNLFKAIEEWRDVDSNRISESGGVTSEIASSRYADEYEATLDSFLGKASENCVDSGAKLIIFYHPSTSIDCDGVLHMATDEESLAIFKNICDEKGIAFIDMTDAFGQMYTEDHVQAHGFINTAVGSGHLNKYGHRAIAETLADFIGGDRDGAK